MPGRIVGRTVDLEGKTGWVPSCPQAREQHIRRGKATSNICTNQGLLMTAGTIYMALLGPEGLSRVAGHCYGQLRALLQALTSLPGVRSVHSGVHFHEAVIEFYHGEGSGRSPRRAAHPPRRGPERFLARAHP